MRNNHTNKILYICSSVTGGGRNVQSTLLPGLFPCRPKGVSVFSVVRHSDTFRYQHPSCSRLFTTESTETGFAGHGKEVEEKCRSDTSTTIPSHYGILGLGTGPYVPSRATL